MLRDKDYLSTKDGLIFNVIGYDHASDRTTANLKYVHGKKWANGYEAAIAFLEKEYPCYVRGLVSVPQSQVTKIHRPQEGLGRLLSQKDRNHLEQTAVDLAKRLSEFFEVPLDRFGVTDSLLWGHGGDGSDADLVVYGGDSAQILLGRMESLFHEPDFERFTAKNFTRQPPPHDPDFAKLCMRKVNKGLYQGVRFSLRAVREYNEISTPEPHHVVGTVEATGRVVDNSESLFFPATYKLDSGLAAMSFLTQHEGVFSVGEVLTVKGTLEQGAKDRIVVGSLHGQGHRIDVSDAL